MNYKTIKDLVVSHPFLENAFFIAGSGRSGTTLMHSLLDDHEQLIVWPFEYEYYAFYEDFLRQQANTSHIKVKDAIEFFKDVDLQYFGKIYGELEFKGYSLEPVDPKVFWDIMHSFSEELVSRKEFLQLMIYAYYQAYCPNIQPKAFVVKIQYPHKETHLDFPHAKFLFMLREPLATYVSIKKYYFKTGNNQYMLYTPGGSGDRFKGGLIEVCLAPIFYIWSWFDKYKEKSQIKVIKLEDLQKQPDTIMPQVSEFLEIHFSPLLLKATMLGRPFGSNLSSKKNTEGAIVQQKKGDFTKELSSYELSWLQKHFSKMQKQFSYNVENINLNIFQRFFSYFKPLKHEAPYKRLWKIYPLFFSFIGFVTTRITFFLISKEKYDTANSPYSCNRESQYFWLARRFIIDRMKILFRKFSRQ